MKHGGYSRQRGSLIWKEIASNWVQLWRGRDPKEIIEVLAWTYLKGRFLKHIWANLKEKEKKKLVAADEKAKERLAATGRTWPKVKYTIEDKSIESLVVEV